MKKLKELVDRDHFEGYLLVASVVKCVNNQGAFYLNLELRDDSGSINAKKWDVAKSDEALFVVGNILYVSGEANLYKTNIQLKVTSARLADKEEYKDVDFVKKAPVPFDKLMSDFTYYRHKIISPDLKAVVDYILEKRKDLYFTSPGGISIHHDYTNGLLHHTVSMLYHVEYFTKIYDDLDEELLIAAVILHDVDKTMEIEGDVAYKRTVEGNLLGHLPMGAMEISAAKEALGIDSEAITLLEHMVLSHHGRPEFGSPVLPMTKEAILLHFIDNIDCQMNLAIKTVETLKEGEFSDKIFALDGRQLYKPHKRDKKA